jgi:hypothetical protein
MGDNDVEIWFHDIGSNSVSHKATHLWIKDVSTTLTFLKTKYNF